MLEISISLRPPAADVFLSPDALAATSLAFGAIPPTRVVQARPVDSIVLVSGSADPLGFDDVLQRLTNGR